MYIANQEALEAFVQRARSSSVLAIDTEFLREKTYYAKLCLLQMATDDEVAIVDPFAIDDLGAIACLLEDEHIVKLFHAGGQDLEIIYHEIGVLPKPIFDTQIAATLLGHTQQIGYGALVNSMCGVSLKKSDSFTDWSRRPLQDSQLEYAADDVVYLPEIYRSMVERLEEKGRLRWLSHDFKELSRRQMSAARELAAWREVEAQHRDVPRKWILTDEQIVEACRREPHSIDDLFMVRGVRERVTTRDARVIVALMEKGMSLPESKWPELDRAGKNERNVDAELDLMNALVRLRAHENDIAMQTLASHGDLAMVARGYTEGVDVLKGWRRAMVGEELLDLLAGRICLSLGPHGLCVVRTE